MLEQHGSTRSTKSNVSSRVESSRDEPSGIWTLSTIAIERHIGRILDYTAVVDEFTVQKAGR